MSWIEDNLDNEIYDDYMNPKKDEQNEESMKTDFMMSLHDRLIDFWKFKDEEKLEGAYIDFDDIQKVLLEFDKKLKTEPLIKPKN